MSYGAPPPPPPSYGPGPTPYGSQPQRTNGKATTALVLGILGVFPCCSIFIFGIAAIVFGVIAQNEIAQSNGTQKGQGLARWGFWLGVAGVALGVLGWILQVSGVVDYNGNN